MPYRPTLRDSRDLRATPGHDPDDALTFADAGGQREAGLPKRILATARALDELRQPDRVARTDHSVNRRTQ